MPWNNQNGGGPWGGGGNSGGPHKGSPWGGGTSGGDKPPRGKPSTGPNGSGGGFGGGGMHPPEMDDLLRKGQERLKQFGGGAMFLVIALILVAFWLYQGFYIVQQDEQAVELRFGVPKEGIIGEGPHFLFWPIETYHKVSRREYDVKIGESDESSLMLSSDQNIVNIKFSVYYNISDARAYIFNVAQPDLTIRQVSESAMREIVGRRPATDVYRNELLAVTGEVRDIIQATLNKYQIGVNVVRVAINESGPPLEVRDAFESFQRSQQERQRAIEEGNQFRARRRGEANGLASRIREDAAARKFTVVENARGQAQRFIAVAGEAKLAPDATRLRLYLETMEQILTSPNKLLLEQGSSGAVPYLPLNELLRGGTTGGRAESDAAVPPTPQTSLQTGNPISGPTGSVSTLPDASGRIGNNNAAPSARPGSTVWIPANSTARGGN